MGFIRYILKHPVTVLMALLCLIVFGISSVMNATLEQMPDTDQPMLIIRAGYSGTSPEDMDELVTRPIENAVSTLEGVESMTSTSSEGSSMVMLQYGYDKDMDEAYDEVKKKVESLRGLPSDMNTPTIMAMSSGAQANLMMTVYNAQQENLYDYVDQKIIPEFEKLAAVAQVEMRGGKSEYIRVLLKSELMEQYGITMSSITQAISAADLTYPSGSARSGNVELQVSTSIENETLDDLLRVPITTGSGKIIYLEDVADIGYTDRDMGGVSRYNGEETMSISVTKQQDYSAMDLSRQVKAAAEALMADDEDLLIEVTRDEADSIASSLKDVVTTMLLAVAISMLVLWLFYGDIKASLIVGSSIPVSILVTLIVMTSVGFTLNIISMSGLVLAVGMMVDNSIVTLEGCFRAKEKTEGEGPDAYAKAALQGSSELFMSILGSTLTTCVVFIPLVGLNGMAGELFGSLGWVIVISMAASILSAITIVPLTYLLYKPKEKAGAPFMKPLHRMEALYRKILPKALHHKALVIVASIALTAVSVVLAMNMESELMPADDTGSVTVSISTRPGLLNEKATEIINTCEAIVAADESVDSYMLRYNGSSGSINAYLKDDRAEDSDKIAERLEKAMADLDNCTITVSADSSMSFMRGGRGYRAIIQGTQYDELREVSNKIVEELIARDDVINVHSSIENTSPVLSIQVDPVAAAAEGITASQIGSQVKSYLSGAELRKLTVNGNEVSVKAEYPEGDYNTVPKLERVFVENGRGKKIALCDVAQIVYKDSPASISKNNKEYQVTISASYVSGNVASVLDNEVIAPNLTGTITKGTDSMTRMMNDEFSGLYKAIAMAVFLVFVVLSAQFESMKFAVMVMTTIPFSIAGSFVLLGLTGVSMSMTSLIGFLILVGTVVNNGILYVDTVNRLRTVEKRELKESLIEAGATRLRPILMTTMTTILSMIPMAAAFGDSGSMTQGLAVVDIGGLAFGIAVALFILPVYYLIMNRSRELRVLDI